MKVDNVIEWHSQGAFEFDLQYKYDKKFIERYHIWTQIINTYSNPNNCVLDVGCGTGVFSLFAAERNKNVIGIDLSDEMLKVCEIKKKQDNLKNLIFMKGDINSLDQISKGEADIVLCSSVLEYIEELEKSLVLLSSILKKGGILILSIPNKTSMYRRVESVVNKITGFPRYYKYVKNVLSLEQMSDKLKVVGFHILESKYYAKTLLFPRLFRNIGFSKYSDNLFVIVAQKV